MRLLPHVLLFLALNASISLAATLRAQVASEADVYAQPNFSSRKIEHLAQGTVVYMKTDKFIGSGGMGVFFKIKTPSGKVGYVVDSDLLAANSDKPIPMPAPAPIPTVQERPAKKEGSATLWGLSVGSVGYSEKIHGKTYAKQHIFFGARRTGSASTITSWRTDFGMLISPGAPKFLAEAGAYGKTTGFIFLSDFLIMKPVLASQKLMLFLAAGPLLAYSNYTTNMENSSFSSQEFRFGGVVDAGFALNFSGNALRLDVKYNVEKTSYLSEIVTLQMAF